MMQQNRSVLEALTVDGKVLRGSGRADGQPLQLISAVSHRLRLTLAQEPIEETSNEIPAIKPLLAKIPCQGTLITADAMHCQQESSRFVTQELRGDYIWGLKGNQSGIMGEDASQISGRKAAQAMATLRNLALGLFELQKDSGKANAPNFPGWLRKMTSSAALKLIMKGT